ncbi:G-box-binding factor 1-like isoform X2 [Castanea sativa]|uniref:G-box-binding factor 1-like isoform X2 n=1 Tax=Castanea sativa TaxID=21020 RepID=UPI003F64BD4D
MGEASEMAKPSKQMGIGEVNMPPKWFVPLFSSQETPKTPSQPDGPTFVQAYYGSEATAPPFVTSSSAASLMFNPYMWGNQVAYQQCMLQYGPGLQYHAPYNKEVYANSNIVKGVGLAIPKKEERFLKGKDLDSMSEHKRSSENLILVGNGSRESEKAASSTRNDGGGPSRSDVSGSEGSSDDSDVMNQEFPKSKRQRFNQLLADGVVARNKASVQDCGANTDLALHDSVANVAETDLNLGMSLSASSAQPFLTKEGIDLRNERRKQSNRESARRSRIRRQECEKLQALAEMLKTETSMLKEELVRLSEECGEVDEENNSLMDELTKMYGPDAISDLIARKPNSGFSESNDNEERIPSGDDSPLHTIRIT